MATVVFNAFVEICRERSTSIRPRAARVRTHLVKRRSSKISRFCRLPVLKPASQLQVPTTQASTLDNGLRVISQETYGQAATLGLFVDAGSRYETGESSSLYIIS